MPDALQVQTGTGTVLPAEGTNGRQGNTGRLIVAVGEHPMELANYQQRMFAAQNQDRTKPLLGGTSYGETSPLLLLYHNGVSNRVVFQRFDLYISNAPGAVVEIEAAYEKADKRYVSGGNPNTNLYALNSQGPKSTVFTLLEGVSGSAIVASSGTGNRIRQIFADNVLGTKVELFKPGELILSGLDSSLLIWAFAASTAPQFTYLLEWEERP